jgi:hypothetical protein
MLANQSTTSEITIKYSSHPPTLSRDVLAYVFAFVGPKSFVPAATSYYRIKPNARPGPLVHLLSFSQVCRHWRQVALSIATLWNAPHFEYRALGVMMLERAGKAPLTITWPPGDLGFVPKQPNKDKNNNPKHRPNVLSFFDTFKDHVAQVSSLNLDTETGEVKAICDFVFLRSSLLRSVNINCVPVKLHQPALLMDYRKSSLNAEATPLTHLKVIGCFIQLPPLFTQYIKKLEIIMSRTAPPVNMNDLLDLLEGAPVLESFDLSMAIGAPSADIATRNVINLTSLRSISMSDYPERMTSVLSCVRAPSLQRFISYTSCHSWREDLSGSTSATNISAYIETTIRQSMAMTNSYNRLTLESHRENSIVISIGNGASNLYMRSSDESDYLPNHAPCQITANFDIKEIEMTEIYSLIVQHGEWSSLRMLEIEIHDYKIDNEDEINPSGTPFGQPMSYHRRSVPTQSQCDKLLGTMSQLETLMLVGDTAAILFLSALAGTQIDWRQDDEHEESLNQEYKYTGLAEGNQDVAPKFCLELKTLHLYKMSLRLAVASYKHEPNELIDLLEVLLRSRQNHKVSIRELRATKAELHENTDEEKDQLKAYFQQWVAEVGLTTTSEDRDDDDDEGGD